MHKEENNCHKTVNPHLLNLCCGDGYTLSSSATEIICHSPRPSQGDLPVLTDTVTFLYF